MSLRALLFEWDRVVLVKASSHWAPGDVTWALNSSQCLPRQDSSFSVHCLFWLVWFLFILFEDKNCVQRESFRNSSRDNDGSLTSK